MEIDRWWVKLLTTYYSIINDKMLKKHRRLCLPAQFWDESISCGQSFGGNALGI